MNRQQRREITKNPEGVFTAFVRAERNRVISSVVHQYSVVMAFVAHDKLELDTEQLVYFLKEVIELHDSINRGYVKIEDLENALQEETGIKVDREI